MDFNDLQRRLNAQVARINEKLSEWIDQTKEYFSQINQKERYGWIGEGVGFLRLNPSTGVTLAKAIDDRLGLGQLDGDYESAIDDMLRTETVHFEQVAPHPWTEIDFAADVKRANEEVLPNL